MTDDESVLSRSLETLKLPIISSLAKLDPTEVMFDNVPEIAPFEVFTESPPFIKNETLP